MNKNIDQWQKIGLAPQENLLDDTILNNIAFLNDEKNRYEKITRCHLLLRNIRDN